MSDAEELGRVRQRYGIGQQPFILSLSTLQPRKNYVRLIQAFARLAPQHPDLLLVLGGGKGWKYDEILAEPARLDIADRVRFPGFVADEDLPALYSAAELFAYPSLYEGFGIPLLEAMACGTPVLSSDRSSLPEVTGTAGIQVDPFDVDAMAAESGAIAHRQPATPGSHRARVCPGRPVHLGKSGRPTDRRLQLGTESLARHGPLGRCWSMIENRV